MIRVPIRTAPGLNVREHWRSRAKRVKAEREAAFMVLAGWKAVCGTPPVPCAVRLTRVGPSNGLDDDNLAGSLKAVRDEVAAWLGVDDKRSDLVRYVYAQRRGAQWCVEIEFGQPVAEVEFKALEAA